MAGRGVAAYPELEPSVILFLELVIALDEERAFMYLLRRRGRAAVGKIDDSDTKSLDFPPLRTPTMIFMSGVPRTLRILLRQLRLFISFISCTFKTFHFSLF